MQPPKKTVLYVGNFLFPTEGAAAKRVLNIGRSLKESGYNVIFAGNNEGYRNEDEQQTGNYKYNEFRYFSRDIKSKIKKKIDNYYSFSRIQKLISKLETEGEKVDIIISYHMDFLGMIECIRYCKRRSITFISDCTEWYDPRQTVHGRFGLAYYNSQLRMLIANKKSDGMIVISKYLEKYYEKYTPVLRVPPLDDVQHMGNNEKIIHNKVKFVYCGSPGRKDDLCSIWDAFEKIGCNENWELNIVGISADYPMFNKNRYSPEVVKRFIFHGRVPIDKAQSIIKESHFSILIRPQNKRHTKAGFPTKFSESLSLGTPIIANITSDISDYIIHGGNGIVVKDNNIGSIISAFKYALNLTADEIDLMRYNAYKSARQSFDYQQYTNKISYFIESVVNKK